MKRKWQYFIGSALLGGYLVFSLGAPPFAVIGGIVLAAVFIARSSQFA
jgi:hypothetical protein